MRDLTFLLLFVGLTNLTMAQSTFIVAHRGFSSIAPENTLSAFQAAIECGAPYFELDVQASAEGVPMSGGVARASVQNVEHMGSAEM